jgi:hypothetical protein
LEVDEATGSVSQVAVQKSTGVQELDDSAVDTFCQWQFMPHTGVKKVKVPVNFTMNLKDLNLTWPAPSQDGTADPGLGPFEAPEVQFMKHAEAVYVFSVKADSPETPNQKDLKPLEPHARQALLGMLCDLDNWNWVTGSAPCESRDVGVLFQNSKDTLILRFCSVYDPYTGCEVEGTFGQKFIVGWMKRHAWESWKQKFAQLEARKPSAGANRRPLCVHILR